MSIVYINPGACEIGKIVYINPLLVFHFIHFSDSLFKNYPLITTFVLKTIIKTKKCKVISYILLTFNSYYFTQLSHSILLLPYSYYYYIYLYLSIITSISFYHTLSLILYIIFWHATQFQQNDHTPALGVHSNL